MITLSFTDIDTFPLTKILLPIEPVEPNPPEPWFVLPKKAGSDTFSKITPDPYMKTIWPILSAVHTV